MQLLVFNPSASTGHCSS